MLWFSTSYTALYFHGPILLSFGFSIILHQSSRLTSLMQTNGVALSSSKFSRELSVGVICYWRSMHLGVENELLDQSLMKRFFSAFIRARSASLCASS